MTKLEELLAHLEKCPLGWHNEKVIHYRTLTEEQLLAWLQEMERLRDEVAGHEAARKRRQK